VLKVNSSFFSIGLLFYAPSERGKRASSSGVELSEQNSLVRRCIWSRLGLWLPSIASASRLSSIFRSRSRQLRRQSAENTACVKAVEFLQQQGFKKVSNLSGGIRAWSDRVDGTRLLLPAATRAAVAVTIPKEGDLVLEMPPLGTGAKTINTPGILYTNDGTENPRLFWEP
jgi:hypothetical protein